MNQTLSKGCSLTQRWPHSSPCPAIYAAIRGRGRAAVWLSTWEWITVFCWDGLHLPESQFVLPAFGMINSRIKAGGY